MLKFDIERAKEVYRCDKNQYNEDSLLTVLQKNLEFLVFYNRNLTKNQCDLIRDCWELACYIETTEANENRKEVD